MVSKNVTKKNIFFYYYFCTFLNCEKQICYWGKKWLFSIGNGAEIQPLEKGRKSPVGCKRQQRFQTTDITLYSNVNQGSYRNGKTEFQDFSRTIPGLFFIFKGLNFFPILYKTTRKNALFSAKSLDMKRYTRFL